MQPVPVTTAVIAVQLAAALGIGMLVGIEREWANKEFGLRAFAFISVLGMMAVHLPTALAAVAFVGVLLLISIAQINNFRAERTLELNTSTALLLVFAGGYLPFSAPRPFHLCALFTGPGDPHASRVPLATQPINRAI